MGGEVAQWDVQGHLVGKGHCPALSVTGPRDRRCIVTLQETSLTQGPKHRFFGYDGIPPWDASNRYVLCLETTFQDHFPGASDTAVVGYVSPILDARSGARLVLPRAISELSHDGRKALCISSSRLPDHMPVIGYAGVPDLYAAQPHPSADGVYVLDVESGDARLIVTYDQVQGYHGERREMDGRYFWISHATFNTDDTRFCFLCRYRPEGQTRWKTALFTANADGGGLKCLIDYGYISHFDWRDPQVLLVFANINGQGDHYYLVDDASGQDTIVGGNVLTRDGHCSFSVDRRWFLTNTYPDAQHMRSLELWHMEDEREVILGHFFSDPALTGEIRCDLHPRWDRPSQQVCFDPVHEGTRQMYVVDVSQIVA
jgi:hypothetical protein